MKSFVTILPKLSRSMVMLMAFLVMVLSCKKSTENTLGPTQIKYCSSIDWSNTVGQSGTFTGAYVDGKYNLVYSEYKDPNGTVGGFPLHYDAKDHLISDQPGVTYTYNVDTLTKITVLNGTNGNGSYKFDGKGRLVGGVMNFTSQGMTGTATGTYIYDSDEDPVKFSGTGTLSTPQGPLNIDLEITGDFLTDKESLLPFQPEFAPASSYFSLIPFTSKHLLNKWDVSYSGGGISTKFTIQYTYTYDADGNVATMVNTGNSNNKYTFTYSGCN
jgi:YD repeat-containing protein